VLPEVVEVCKLQGGVSVREEFAVALVDHVTLNRFRRVERAALLVAPQTHVSGADLLSCDTRKSNTEKM